jgi:hypothetical protein
MTIALVTFAATSPVTFPAAAWLWDRLRAGAR